MERAFTVADPLGKTFVLIWDHALLEAVRQKHKVLCGSPGRHLWNGRQCHFVPRSQASRTFILESEAARGAQSDRHWCNFSFSVLVNCMIFLASELVAEKQLPTGELGGLEQRCAQDAGTHLQDLTVFEANRRSGWCQRDRVFRVFLCWCCRRRRSKEAKS